MQLIGAATPDVPNQTPMPQPSKQLLNACPVPPMDIVVTLLAGCQSAILSSNEWHNDMNPAFISAIMAPNFKIKEIPSGTRRSVPIPNQRERNRKSKPTPGVTMMHHATKRGFKDCPGFLNSTGRLGPKRGRKCYITPAFSGVPNKGNKIGSQNLRRGSP